MTEPVEAGFVSVRGSADGFIQEITAGRHWMVADEPEAVGGTDRGPGPYDLLLAALGACTSMTIALYARRKNWRLTNVAVHLRHARVHADDCSECETQSRMLDQIEREIAFDGDLSDVQRAKLLEIADKCPVHRTLTSEIRIRTKEIRRS